MAATVSRIFRNKFFRERRLLTKINADYTQISSSSTQTQPSIKDDEPLEVKINPLKHPDYFEVSKLFTVKDLFDARVHYGHKEGSLDDKMRPFLYGSRLGHLIFDLDQTAELFRHALNFTAHVAYNSGIILFVCRSAQHAHVVEKTAFESGEFSHTRRWSEGTFTNATKEFGAVTRLPDLCIFLSTLDNVMLEHQAVRSAAKMCIPTVGIVDSNCNPNLITYPVPGNDDSPSAIELYCKLFKKAILLGKEAKERDNKQT